jgi:hypothetical protein
MPMMRCPVGRKIFAWSHRYRGFSEFQEDLAALQASSAVPTILEVVCNTTGMGFAAIARVTPERWACLASHDEIGLGLKPGGELAVDTTLCHEVRLARGVVAIDHVAEDAAYRLHRTPAMLHLHADGRSFEPVNETFLHEVVRRVPRPDPMSVHSSQ